jgi:conjugative relaxase-like TrwC/TraI family protein
MLSIGKLAAGQAEYYLEQARGSVTRAGAVGSGVEDYYVGGGEAPGVWMGDGAALLRLSGGVGDDGLRRALSGEHPATGASLGRQTGGKRVPGLDVTWSAPKSVSVLFGIGDDRVGGVVQAAHDRAVADAFGYLERQAAVTRRGAGGVHRIPGRGLVAAGFRHRTSRADDPQLHTHVLVANVTLGVDGRWSALDGRRLYAHGKTAGYVYEARLRAELTRELGVEWVAVRNGIADISRLRCCVGSAGGGRRSTPSFSGMERGARRRRRWRRWRLGDGRTTASARSGSCRSGASGRRASDSSRGGFQRC